MIFGRGKIYPTIFTVPMYNHEGTHKICITRPSRKPIKPSLKKKIEWRKKSLAAAFFDHITKYLDGYPPIHVISSERGVGWGKKEFLEP
jgi:hypothetical protein